MYNIIAQHLLKLCLVPLAKDAVPGVCWDSKEIKRKFVKLRSLYHGIQSASLNI